MEIRGTAVEAFSKGLKEAIELVQRHYLALAIPVALGFVWGIISQIFLYGGIMTLVSSVMTKEPGPGMITGFGHLAFVLILSMAISILIWMVTFAGAGLILKHRNDEFQLTFDEILSYTGNRLGPLVIGGILYAFLPFVPMMIPVVGILYFIGFVVYIFFIGKNYGGFFFWAYPVITTDKSASEGFTIAKEAVLSKKSSFWITLVLGFIAMWITDIFLGLIPYIGYLLIWAVNFTFLLFMGIIYYDYKGEIAPAEIQPHTNSSDSPEQ